MDEIQHAFIVSEFYRLLMAHDGENGISVFRMAAITYGEQRGKRMAMRALRDGHPLDYEGYFAYGEYPSTDAYFDVDMWDEQGVVNERVTRCPWAKVFAERGMKECGVAYCREIDRAIVRGFNPELELETASTQHLQGCCRFYFRDQKVYPGLLEKAGALTQNRSDISKPMDYHCGHVFHAFSKTVKGVYGQAGAEMCGQVIEAFRGAFGEQMTGSLLENAKADFETIEE